MCWSKDRTEFVEDFLLNLFQNSPDLSCDDILDVDDETDLIEAYVSEDDLEEFEERVSEEYEEFLCLDMTEGGAGLTRQWRDSHQVAALRRAPSHGEKWEISSLFSMICFYLNGFLD